MRYESQFPSCSVPYGSYLKLAAFRMAAAVMPLLPARLCYGAAWLGAAAAYRLAGGTRRVVQQNLAQVMGQPPNAPAVVAAAKSVFRTQAYNYVDLFQIPAISPEELAKRVELLRGDRLRTAHGMGKGAIIVTAHLGNFDLLVQVARVYGLTVTVLVERLAPQPLFELVCRLRAAHGVELLPAGPSGARALLRKLREGGIIAIAADRDVQRRGKRMRFFGRETSMPAGAAQLARHTGATLVPAFGRRLPARRYTITVEEPISPLDAAGRPRGETELQQQIISVLERHIGAYPGQWVVFEPVWSSNFQVPSSKLSAGEP